MNEAKISKLELRNIWITLPKIMMLIKMVIKEITLQYIDDEKGGSVLQGNFMVSRLRSQDILKEKGERKKFAL